MTIAQNRIIEIVLFGHQTLQFKTQEQQTITLIYIPKIQGPTERLVPKGFPRDMAPPLPEEINFMSRPLRPIGTIGASTAQGLPQRYGTPPPRRNLSLN
jgi:hypothetical protein